MSLEGAHSGMHVNSDQKRNVILKLFRRKKSRDPRPNQLPASKVNDSNWRTYSDMCLQWVFFLFWVFGFLQHCLRCTPPWNHKELQWWNWWFVLKMPYLFKVSGTSVMGVSNKHVKKNGEACCVDRHPLLSWAKDNCNLATGGDTAAATVAGKGCNPLIGHVSDASRSSDYTLGCAYS